MSGLGNILHQRQLNYCQSATSIGYVAVPIKDFQDLLGLIDPPPVKTPSGTVMVFVNPHSAEVLTRISAIVRRMQDAALAHQIAATAEQEQHEKLLQLAVAVRDATWEESAEGWNGEYPEYAEPKVDLAAIVDRYAAAQKGGAV